MTTQQHPLPGATNQERQPMQRTLSQKRANAAYEAVQNTPIGECTKYKQLAQRAPADMQTNGIGQTLAFWKAKGEPEHQRLINDVTSWLRAQMGIPTQQDALEWLVVTASPEEARRALAETIALLVWIKRFAEGFIS